MKWWIKETDATLREWDRNTLARLLGASIGPEPEGKVTIKGKTLFPLTDAGPQPPAGQRQASRTVTDDGDTATAEYTYEAVPLAERKAKMKADATARFRAVRDGGTVVTLGQTDVTVATTHEAAVEIDNAIAQLGGAGSMKVVTRSGARVVLTPAIASAMIGAIRDHVEAAQECEYDLHEAIDAVADDADPTTGNAALDLIDVQAGTITVLDPPNEPEVTGGWPSND